MFYRFCLAAEILIATSLGADSQGAELSFKTKDGRTFEKVIVTNVLAHRIEVMKASGMDLVHIVDLPDELQKRFVGEGKAIAPPKVGDKFELKLSDGRALKDAVLRRMEPDGLVFETGEGLEKVPHAKLPPELAAHFGYNDENVARFRAAQDAQQKAIAAQLAAEAAAARPTPPATVPPPAPATPRRAEPRLGERGSERLGKPQLGGSGLQK